MSDIYFKMALLNIGRRKRRSVLIAMMIALSMIGLLLMEGMYDGMMVQITQNTIKTGSGAVTIQAKAFRSTENIQDHIEQTEKIEEALERNEEVASYVKRVVHRGLIATAGYSQGVTVFGVDLDHEADHARLDNYIIKGDYSFAKRERGAIIGYKLARKLRVDIGKKVIVTMQDIDNEVVAVALKVRGIIKTNNMAIDNSGILMSRNMLKSLIGLKGVTEYALLLKDLKSAYDVKKELAVDLNDDSLAIYAYKELYPSLYQGEVLMQTFNTVSAVFIFIIASLGIFGVVLVSVLERVREFGIMMAIGTQFRDISVMIVFESLIITLGGYAVGALIGGVLLLYLKHFGLDLTGLSDAFAIFGMDPNIRAVIKYEYFSSTFVSVVIATLMATIIPIRTLKKRKPIESINEAV